MAEGGESLGAARIDIVVDTSQFDTAINLAKTRVSDMTGSAQKQYAELNKAERRRVDSLVNQANTIGLTKEEQIAYNAALKVEGPLLDQITQKLARNTSAYKAQGTAAGLSAKQQAAALRGVPAQITDIFTSLQGGQNPLTVLFQQGGQLKDMFGGITPAANALSRTLFGMINPATLLVGAIAGIGVAAFKGSNELDALTDSLILSGNRIGTTTSELSAMANEIAAAGTGSIGAASEALGILAQSGAVTKTQLQSATTAALAFQKATGQAVDETAKQFKSIQQGPTKAITELNEKYNFLTPAIYKQIRAMEESGKKSDAAALATAEYTKALGKMATDVNANAGILERAWNGIAGAAKSAWDAMLGIGRQTTPDQKIKKLGDDLDQLMAWTPKNEKDNARRLESISKIGKELDTLIGKQVEEAKSADASAKNAKAVEATAKAMDDAAKNADKYKKALEELKKAQQTMMGQFFEFIDVQREADDEAIRSANDRAVALEKEADKYRDLLDPTRELSRELANIQKLVEAGALSADEGMAAEIDKLKKFYKGSTDELDEFTKSAAKNMQSAFADFLFDPFSEGMGGMLKGFGNTMKRMVAESVAADLMGRLFPSIGGPKKSSGSSGIGDFIGMIGGLFGGGLASGGPASAGKIYEVNEGGKPEMFNAGGRQFLMPNMNGEVVNNRDASMSASQGLVVNVNVAPGTPDQVRRAAGAGAREGLAALNSASRYA